MKKQFLIILILLFSITPNIEAQPITHILNMPGLSAIYNDGSVTFNKLGWSEEIIISGLGSPIESLDGDKVILNYGFATIELYTIPEGFEYMIIFDSRPSNPRVSLPVESQGLTWYYQPPLTEEYDPIPNGWVVNETHAFNELGELEAYRPLNVVGSYAVYSSTNRDNQYKTGKFTHIYRPLVYDSIGAETWADMVYDGEYLHIDLDNAWLKDKSRIYPVYVDPIFGSNTTSGGLYSIESYVRGYTGSPASDGNATMITAHIYAGSGYNGGVIGALYYANGSLIATTNFYNVSSTNWYNFTFTPEVRVYASESYAMVMLAQSLAGACSLLGDAGAGAVRKSGVVYPAYPDPIVFSDTLAIHDIYVRYIAIIPNNPPNRPNLTNPGNNTLYRTNTPFNSTWTFSDPDGDPQAAYRLRVDDNSSFPSPYYDSGQVNNANNWQNYTGPNICGLYYWCVIVWDASGDTNTSLIGRYEVGPYIQVQIRNASMPLIGVNVSIIQGGITLFNGLTNATGHVAGLVHVGLNTTLTAVIAGYSELDLSFIPFANDYRVYILSPTGGGGGIGIWTIFGFIGLLGYAYSRSRR